MSVKTLILIADDDLDSLAKMYLKLLHKQIKTEATNDANEIIPQIIKFKPKIVLISPSLVGEHVCEFCKKIKCEFRVVPILLIDQADENSYSFDTVTRQVDVDHLIEIISLYR